MLIAEFIVKIKPERDHNLPISTAKSLLGMLLRLVRSVDADYSKFLHDSNTTKPFTISRLKGKFVKNEDGLIVSSEEIYAFRMTSVSEKLSRILIEAISPSFASQEKVNLWGEFFTVVSFAVASEKNYPAIITFEEVKKAAQKLSENTKEAEVKFVSPTAFRYNRKNILFPQPEILYRSLGLRIKNLFGELLNESEMLTDDEVQAINIESYKLRTKVVNFLDIPMQGFIGNVVYDFSKLPKDSLYKAFLPLLLLNYIGVGAKTTMGMGQAYLELKDAKGVFK